MEREEYYVDALVNELKAYGKVVNGQHTIASIFIGGGTPTVLSPFLLEKICACIREVFVLEESLEWTIEANPGTITRAHAEVFKAQGVNRVSLGLQACQSSLLKSLGRIHSLEAWVESLQNLRAVGIENINTDLMFGLPGQTLEDWQQTIQQVVAYQVPHISAYGLIIEEGTHFYDLYEQGRLQLPPEEVERDMYTYAKTYLDTQGYTHYEISNWAKKGKACAHNVRYWEQGEYIGSGLGAHGYLDGKRYHNTYDLQAYNKAQGDISQMVEEVEMITPKMQMEEFMFLGLRLVEGVDTKVFEEKFQKSMDSVYGDILRKWINCGGLVKNNNRIYLSEQGRDISNQIMSDFLIEA